MLPLDETFDIHAVEDAFISLICKQRKILRPIVFEGERRMNRTLSTVVFVSLLCCIVIFGFGAYPCHSPDPYEVLWWRTYGGSANDCAYSLVQTADGGYAIVGETHSFGPSLHNYWLVKTDPEGNTAWSRTFGEGDCEAYDVIQTRDGGYAIAGTKGFGGGQDFWLVKTNSFGNMEWNRTYGWQDPCWEAAYSLIQTPDDGYALAGGTGPYDSGSDSPNSDFWLVKTDSNGIMQWNMTYGGASQDMARCLARTADSGYVMVGHAWSFGAGSADAWLVKTDYLGNMQWNRTYGGTGEDYASYVIRTNDGGYAIAGHTNPSGAGYDFWLIKTNSLGNMQWSRTYGVSHDDDARCVIQTSDGGYLLIGGTGVLGTSDSWNAWLVETDSGGNMRWSETYGGGDEDWVYSIVQTGGGYAMAGYAKSYGSGEADFWLIRVAAPFPVGGYSTSMKEQANAELLAPYLTMMAALATGFIVVRRRTTENT